MKNKDIHSLYIPILTAMLAVGTLGVGYAYWEDKSSIQIAVTTARYSLKSQSAALNRAANLPVSVGPDGSVLIFNYTLRDEAEDEASEFVIPLIYDGYAIYDGEEEVLTQPADGQEAVIEDERSIQVRLELDEATMTRLEQYVRGQLGEAGSSQKLFTLKFYFAQAEMEEGWAYQVEEVIEVHFPEAESYPVEQEDELEAKQAHDTVVSEG